MPGELGGLVLGDERVAVGDFDNSPLGEGVGELSSVPRRTRARAAQSPR